MIGTVAVRHYMAIMRKRGLPVDAVLHESGVDGRRLSDPAHVIERSQYRTVVSNVLNITGDNGVAFDFSQFTDLSTFGILGPAISTCATVRDAHNLWCRFGPSIVGNLATLTVLRENMQSVTLSVVSPDSTDPLYRFAIEEIMGNLMVKPPGDDPPRVLGLTFSYPAPPHVSRYRDLFDCPISFSAERTTVTVARDWMDSPGRSADREFNLLCLQHCENVLHRIENTRAVIAALRSIFLRCVDRPPPKLEDAARLLYLTPRTLRRRLLSEGTTYRAQVDGYRKEQAMRYLRAGSFSAKEVAYLLGFSEQSAFRSAFKSWTGQTVGEFLDERQCKRQEMSDTVRIYESKAAQAALSH
jgi:AraC-like DNA-binding protein